MNLALAIPGIDECSAVCADVAAPVEGEMEYQTNGGINDD